MQLSEIGEFGFIDRFSGKFSGLLQPAVHGIGDDCAIMPLDDQFEQVVTTDLLIEDIHFLKAAISPFDLGYKALAVNLSDIAAMGAQPTGSFLSIALPSDVDVEYMDEVMNGYHQLSEKYKVPLLGGDTTKSPGKIIINVCVTGKVKKGEAKLRSSAQNGDAICVTGFLGDSGAGLKVLLDGLTPDTNSKKLVSWHNKPEPAVDEGLWLGKYSGVHAMMDLSDGIASDLGHILQKSDKGAIIHLEKIPISPELQQTASDNQWDALKLALTGGEDYRLLLTIDSEKVNPIKEAYNKTFSHPLSIVGTITNKPSGEIQWKKSGKLVPLHKGGFNHFSP